MIEHREKISAFFYFDKNTENEKFVNSLFLKPFYIGLVIKIVIIFYMSCWQRFYFNNCKINFTSNISVYTMVYVQLHLYEDNLDLT